MFQNMENIEKLKKFSNDFQAWGSIKICTFNPVKARDQATFRTRAGWIQRGPIAIASDADLTCSFKWGTNNTWFVPLLQTNDAGIQNLFNNSDAANAEVGQLYQLDTPVVMNANNWTTIGVANIYIVKATKPSSGQGTWYVTTSDLSSSTANTKLTRNYVSYYPYGVAIDLYSTPLIKIPSV